MLDAVSIARQSASSKRRDPIRREDAPNDRRETARSGDRLELSDAARRPGAGDDIRTDLVNRVKQAIANDDYLTREKLAAAVNRLHASLRP